ncbi:uncharacterized protein LOC133788743 isoform X2 [Humulus lupulus]|nr:uncharacterized protein LOC133788743 isoform X2 [Humulus lupulus]XP_062082317.1 uncharacterized protein LOC133788743 isoform X2 [Humulus lupulus]
MLSMPKAPFLAVGLLEALGAATGMAAGAILSGASIPILSQTFLVWQILLSVVFLGRKYRVNQLLGCFLVAIGVIITVASGSSAGHSLKEAGIFWSLLMILSFLFQAADTVLKEVIFLDAAQRLKGRTVDLFVVNSFGSAFQALFICILLPFLSKLWGVPFSKLPNYLKDGAACFLNTGGLSEGCDGAPLLPLLFIIVNMGFNISLLHLLKISSAVVSCLASTFSGMTRVVIYAQYDGEWKDEQGLYKWSPKNKEVISIIVDDSNITFEVLLEILYKKIGVNQNDIELKISYLPIIAGENMPPLILRGDECLAAYLLDYGENNRRVALRVELIKREDIRDMEVERSMKENEQSLVDEYFDREFYFENNICDATSAPGESGVNLGCKPVDLLNKRTTSSSPTQNHIDPLNYYDLLDHHDEQNQVPSEDTFSFPDGSDLAIGQEFKIKDEVKTKLNDIAIKACFEMEINKSTKLLYVTKCIDKSCNWVVRAAKVTNSEHFSIRTYCNTHTCSLISQKRKHRQASAAVIANVVGSSFDGQKETSKPKEIMMIMQNNHMPITYWKAWKGEKIANNLLRGSLELSFQNLPAYLYMVQKMNPGTITHLEVDEDSKFKYVFLAYGACIKGFHCMRKVIPVDGTWLKTKYKGVMLIATTQDGNFHQYPIAWAVVDSENDASWSWFLTKLQELILDDSDLVFILDRNQSIINGVSNIYRKSQHGHCRWHLSQNIKARVRVKGVIKLFEEIANAYKNSDFNKLYDELKNRYPVAVKYLEESNLTLSKWARSHFTGCLYNIMTMNGAESINAELREPREDPIIALLEAMQAKVSEWFNNRCNIVASINTKCTPLTPKAENIIRKRFKKAS